MVNVGIDIKEVLDLLVTLDPHHLLNLAVTDGKDGSGIGIFFLFIKRCNIFNQFLSPEKLPY